MVILSCFITCKRSVVSRRQELVSMRRRLRVPLDTCIRVTSSIGELVKGLLIKRCLIELSLNVC